MKKKNSKTKRALSRNPYVLPARMRKAGPHKDSRKKRGKDQNWEKDWRDEIDKSSANMEKNKWN